MSRVLPILFNGDMVRAILDGRKTVTRRVIKFPVNSFTGRIPIADDVRVSTNTLWSKEVSFSEGSATFDIKPPYGTGDILYVRETWNINNLFSENDKQFYAIFEYKADRSHITEKISEKMYEKYEESMAENMPEWRPSIHMPREAARIWLKVRNLKAERLQDISEAQAAAEGAIKCYEVVRPDETKPVIYYAEDGRGYFVPDFKAIWNSTIKKPDIDRYGWAANPWVWVIEFERCGKPEEK